MSISHYLKPVAGTLAALTLALSGGVQSPAQVRTAAHPAVRITAKIDNASRLLLPGTHPAVVEHAVLGSRLSASIPLSHMRLVLRASDEQELALRTLMAEQQDKTSPNYHKWLTPVTFGQYFGAASSDVAQITAWLQDQGFAVDNVAKGNRIIEFSGTVGQVEAAFHTQMNRLTVEGEQHIANVSDVEIPTALSSVVAGVDALNDFFPKSNAVNPQKATIQFRIPANNYITPDAQPMYTSASTGKHYVAPGDAAVIFNSTPLLNASIDGTGQTIAVLGRSNISVSDVQQFRSMFGLKKNDPTVTVISTDPGINSDDLEAYLDVEWAGGMAPGAAVNFIVGGSDYTTSSGINSAGLYAVDNNIGDIITLSYGGCETGNGASGTAFWNTLWEQAAAQGQTVFVSSGDSDATGCSSSSAATGTAYGVNALGSSAYNVAVGGTMFVDFGPSQYWNPPNTSTPFTTAISYMPEAAWNESALTTTYLNDASTTLQAGSGIVGTGGGISIYTARPAWQTGSGISSTADPTCSATVGGLCSAASSPITGVHRLVPDIAFIASGHDPTIFCGEGVCQNNSAGYSIGAISGTSVATPVMASVQALINQKNGGRQGNANFFYYPLANADYTNSSVNCKSTNGTAAAPTVTLPGATCNFHDVIAGDNRAPRSSTDTTGLGFYAGAGFDAATGLGSVNINNVATNWSTVSLRATTTSFTLSPAIITHGTAQTVTVAVSPASGSGVPTGDFSIIAETTTPSAKLRYTLASGAYAGTINGLPAGSYKLHVHYEGDGTFGPSDSASIAVSIAKEGSTTASTVQYIQGSSIFSNPTTVPYGVALFINTKVTASSSATTVPTGTITYGVTRNGVALPSATQTLDGFGDASLQSGANSTPFYIAAQYPALTPGAYVITASYSGDNTYTASTIASSFTVVTVAPTVALTTSASNITSGTSVTLNYSVNRPTGTYYQPVGAFPTGSVTFTDTTTATVLGTSAIGSNQIASLSTSAITTAGGHTISAVYAGDSNYTTTTTSATVTVGTLTATTTTLAVSTGTGVNVSTTGPFYVGTATNLVATLAGGPTTGTVRFYDGLTYLGAASAASSTATLITASIPAGTRALSAVYVGTTTYASSTGTASLTVLQNPDTVSIVAPATSTYGQAVVITGRITRSPSSSTAPTLGLTGTITFTDGATTIATGTPVFQVGGYGFYTATTNTSTLTAGSHTLQVAYGGDANYAAATSGTVTISVAQLTPVLALSSAATVYASGSSLVLTATVPLSGALAAPTGGVTFYDGSTALGTVTPTYSAAAGGYVASYTATGLSSGTHALTAVLASDSNYAAASGSLSVLLTTNNVWVANGNGTVSGLKANGAVVTPAGISGGGTAVAIDNSGNVWSLNKSGSKVAEYSSTGAVLNSGITGGGINTPTALAIDGAGYVWVTNDSGTLSVLTSAGVPVNTAAYQTSLSSPTSVNVDSSGSLWITNSGDNSVTEVIGVATPVTTPTTTAVTNGTLAAKP